MNKLNYGNVHTKIGDGYLGWPEAAPFDKIIVTCSPEKVPQPLVDQLRDGGLMIVPVGERYQQNLYLFRKQGDKLESEALTATLFVPMTGEAEERREVQPDPLNPRIANGSFEDVLESSSANEPAPAGWHYQRQLTLTSDASAPDGARYARLKNSERSRPSQALQGFAVDGRKIDELQFSFAVRGRDIGPGQRQTDWPVIEIMFYDDRRAMIDRDLIGPFTGSFDWRTETHTVKVPLKAHEAIIRISMQGGVGELAFDKLELRVAP